MYTIRKWSDNSVIYVAEQANTVKEAIVAALASKADLRGADLRGAYLRGADLRGAYLQGADLQGAYLRGAYLRGAYLRGADLRGAYLRGADLRGADLRGAHLRGADLRGAYLQDIRNDVWAVCMYAIAEVPGLIQAIKDGKIDGSCYEGECACLVGSIANIRKCDYDTIPGLTPTPSRPAEVWFTGMKPGDTPENSQISAITLGWLEEFSALVNREAK